MDIEKILFSIMGGIFQGFSTSIVVKAMINKINKKQLLILFVMLSIYGSISLLYIDNKFRFISFLIIVTLIVYFLLDIKDKKAILYSFITEMIISISEIITSLILILVGINSKKIVINYKYNLLANMLISMVIIIIGLSKTIRKNTVKIINLFDQKKKLINYFYIFIIVLYLLVLKNGFEFLLKANYYINVLFILGLFLILLILVSNEKKAENLKEQYKQMLSYVTKYEKIITEQGKANHEFKNQLMVIRGYAQMNNMTKLIKYLDTIIEDSKKTKSSYLIRELNKFPDGGIKGLLYYKLSIMEEEKIKYEMNVEKGVKTKLKDLNEEEYKNITKILGVLLDNAIESSSKAKEKEIIITTEKDKDKVIFTISNTYRGKIEIEKIGTGYTSKGKNRGYGLRLVKDITESNNKYKVNNSVENKHYVSKLSIVINKK